MGFAYLFGLLLVAPFVGAWIEIHKNGLSYVPFDVAPFVGAWIEIPYSLKHNTPPPGRSLRGSVD